ncbi:hypothetical protein HDU96_004465 [Phlyctochytrium bullatum]|nr:hypothetical protein HDU96_004465 [Phlyctochytrium bullatum]
MTDNGHPSASTPFTDDSDGWETMSTKSHAPTNHTSDDGWETMSSESGAGPHSPRPLEDDFVNRCSFWFPCSDTTVPSFRYRASSPRTLIEQRYQQYLCEILCKPLWWEKLKNAAILERWKAELPRDVEFSLDFMRGELGFIARGLIEPLYGNRCFWPVVPCDAYISDNIVPAPLAARLTSLLAPVEAEALTQGRWHPEAPHTLDVIHPSHHCGVYKRTRYSVTPHVVLGDHILRLPRHVLDAVDHAGADDENGEAADVSRRFQWLPSEFDVDARGRVTIRSYINNLHPRRYGELYRVIAGVFQYLLPMFERAVGCISDPDARPGAPVRVAYDADKVETLDDFISSRWEEHKASSMGDRRAFLELVRLSLNEDGEGAAAPEDDEWLSEDEEEDLFRQYYENLYDDGQIDDDLYVEKPEFPPFDAFMEEWGLSMMNKPHHDLHGQRLKVIVKVSAIHLTPENPTYPGGSWHLEGTANECIAATGIYYYSVDNIADSTVQFRTTIHEDQIPYHQSEHHWIERIFGLRNDVSLNVQPAGHVRTAEHRALVFPNTQQHRVPPFGLRDPTKPGHRKMLVFFLVHPDANVPSTLHVPPQQNEWAVEELGRVLGARLPEVCIREIVAASRCTRTAARDRAVVKEVIEERKVGSQNFPNAFIHEISLCEH